ncbi:MAG: KUP/HAK/KT family potassium transporter [Prevotella melaninogenica]|nr:KUP/HAK/KT family potassium transporter [Prevotella melaninogenica]
MTRDNNCSNSARHKLSLMGVIVTLGIVFGDIGTSPLYVMKAIVRAGNPVNAEYIIGAVSCIIWTLTLQTTVKYVLIALRADNKGEGGILALYALIRRHSRKWFYFLAIIGASTLIADGVITPSITVLSAIEGLKVYEPETPVVPIALCIVTVLFFIQQFGTNMIGKLFGPLMLLWFSMLGVLGAMHIGDYIPILQAFNPLHAIRLLTSNPEWFLILGAVFLCTTGAEALYSDLGHCGINNIRTSWAFVKVMLILNYLGQGAWIIAHVDNLTSGLNPFYAIMPHGMLFFGIVMATIAAIIASQALISGSFTIFSEAMNLKFWPRQKIKYPTDVKGQLYIPFVNMSLFILCVIVILFFQSSERMEAAYGLSITITMLMTTFLLSAYLTIRRVNRWLTLLFLIVFVGLESIFFIANMAKFMNGGWVTMLLASVMIAIMYVWYNATTIRNSQIQIRDVRESFSIISDIKNDDSIPKYATNIVYLTKLGGKYDIEQKILYSIINKHPMRADHYFLLHIDYQDSPSTLEYDVTTLVPDTLYRINLRLGFRIHPLVNRYFRQIIEDMVAKNEFSLASSYPSLAKHNVMGNFVFVLINRIYSTFASFSFKERLIMDAYEWIDHLKLSMTRSLSLNTSNVLIENVPLTLKSHAKKVGNSIPRVERIEENGGLPLNPNC